MVMTVGNIEPGQAVAVDWSAERYHADTTAISRSQLVELMERPALYYATREAKIVAPPKQTKAMTLGQDVHTCVLEPHLWPARVSQMKRDVATDKQRAALRAYIEQVMWMASSVRSHASVRALYTRPHVCEQTILWRTDPFCYEVEGEPRESTLLVRVRVDAMFDFGETLLVPDIKTTDNAEIGAFRRSCAKFKYHVQAAMYRDAIAALHPDRNVHFMFVAVAKTPPFESACYDLDDDFVQLGRNQYQDAMVDLLRRRETGDWRADWQRSVHTLEAPKWA